MFGRRLRIAFVICMLGAAHSLCAGSLADPTRPFSVSRSPAGRVVSEFSVTAIFRSEQRQVAVVNGVVVQAGDRLRDARILEVLPDGVRYERQGRQFTIRVASLAIKVRTPARDTAESQEVSP
jgi:sRNA-binding protein